MPWGGTIAEGASVTAYGNPLLVSGSKYRCPSETRACTGGVLSGALANETCGSAPTGCDLPWGGTIAIGDSVTA